MGKKRTSDKKIIKEIAENGKVVADNTTKTNEKLDDIKNNTDEIKKTVTSKVTIIIGICTLIVTILGVLVSIFKNDSLTSPSSNEPEIEYTIYLYPEYSKINVNTEVKMTASLNFETDSVSITAHLASGREDTLSLAQKNETEWEKKVVFDEVGTHKIIVAAQAPDGEMIENSVEVEVIPGMGQMLFGEYLKTR